MEEPNQFLRWTIYFFASGRSAMCGAWGIALVLLLALRPGRALPRSASLVAFVVVIGVFLIVCGSPVLPGWFIVLTVAWGAFLMLRWLRSLFHFERMDLKPDHRLSNSLIASSPVIWLLLGLAVEFPYQIWSAPRAKASRLLVIGDSVTAGLNDGEITWPKILPRDLKIEVLDASQPGATLLSARRQNELFAQKAGLLVLEIGGNDMLEGLPVEQFEKDLEQLLSESATPDRTLVMFELPLPPLCTRYGAIQRKLARRHHASIIPKHYFIQVLTSRGATVDGIHLSAAGQNQMARLMASLLTTNVEAGDGTYEHLGP